MALNLLKTLLKRNDLCKLLNHSRNTSEDGALLIRLLSSARNVHSSNIKKQVFNDPIRSQFFCAYRFYSVKTAEQQDINNYRTEHKITVIGQDIPSPFTDIDNSEFPDYIKKFLKSQGFEKPTVIQSQGWPVALSGQNFVGIAQTGTGKTLAYLLPAVVHIKEKEARRGLGPRALVLAPTRELARQIEQVAKNFRKLLNVKCACIYGGASRSAQANILEAGVDILIATPGRLNDFLVSKTTTLCRCTYVVLDEADRMLDMGFEPQIRQALEGVPLERQILMFSATWPKEVQHLAKDYLGEYVQVNVGSTELSANHNIEQHIHICEQQAKLDKFKSIMHSIAGDGFGKLLVFTNTKRFVDNLTLMLKRNGWPAVGIHGDRTQLQRDTIINRFKSGHTNILVATDVAARGLDVSGVTHVINYDFPNTSEDYIHRIGRTGRQQNKGVAHTMLTEDDARQAQSLIAVLKEANQEVPKELMDLARSFRLNKTKEHQYKKSYSYKSNYNQNWNPNKRFNKFRSNSMDRPNFRNDRYDRY
ncbi:ATP-dependent RNA helicase p62 [Amyelois transitella]|uniref:ATP-dependent RNA helicase p62 n=1 Tax=Amyelois transitella TaxID=680683 RepID=UPI00298FAB5E|nr:ATP-dependent RNA helicase p62 [Amyelois transitella]